MLYDQAALLQFIKYALAGGVATITHIIIFHSVGWKLFPALQQGDLFVRLFQLDVPPIQDERRARNSMITNFIAFMGSNFVAYLLNIFFVFQPGRHHIIVEIVLFYLVSGISMVIGTFLMGFLIKRFGLLTTYAFGINIVSAVMINYVVRKFFIFSG